MSQLTTTDYMIALLERIAFQTAITKFDFKDYIERTVIPNAVTIGNKIPSKDNQHGEKDPPRVPTGQQQGNRGKKSRFWRDPHS